MLAAIGLVSAFTIVLFAIVKSGSISDSVADDLDCAAEFAYTVDDGSVVIDQYTGNRTSVAIPAKIEGVPVTAIGDYAFYECGKLSEVTLPDSLEGIGHGAFEGCTSLKSITNWSSLYLKTAKS